MNALLRYFDLNSKIRANRPEAIADEGKDALHWIPQYLALVFGIFIEPFLADYQAHGTWHFVGGWGRLLFAAIVGFAVFPQVYKKIVTDPRPLFAQLGVIFTAGLGWKTLLDAGMKMAGQ